MCSFASSHQHITPIVDFDSACVSVCLGACKKGSPDIPLSNSILFRSEVENKHFQGFQRWIGRWTNRWADPLKETHLKRGISQEPFSRTYYLGQKSSATYGTGPFIDKIMSNLLSQTPKHYLWPPPDMMTPSALCAINLRRPWRHSFMPSCHTFFLNFFHFFFQWRIFFETMSFPSKASYRNELGPELKLFCSRMWNP